MRDFLFQPGFRYLQPDNESSSSSTQSTSSTTQNNQVAADNGGIAIGAGASYVNDFSPTVANAVQNVIDRVFNFSGSVVTAANSIVNQSQAQAAAAVAASNSTANQALNNSQLGQSSIFTNPAVVLGILGGVGLMLYFATKRR